MFSFIILIFLPYVIAYASLNSAAYAAAVVGITYAVYCALDWIIRKAQRKLLEAYEKLMEEEDL